MDKQTDNNDEKEKKKEKKGKELGSDMRYDSELGYDTIRAIRYDER